MEQQLAVSRLAQDQRILDLEQNQAIQLALKDQRILNLEQNQADYVAINTTFKTMSTTLTNELNLRNEEIITLNEKNVIIILIKDTIKQKKC